MGTLIYSILSLMLAVPLQLSAAASCEQLDFARVGPFVVGGSPLNVVTADFNRDGNLDFALPDSVSKVVVYYGDGAGGFTGPHYFPAGNYPHAIVVGDFNRDGNLDMAVAAGVDGSGAGVEILLNNGDGTFSAPTLYPAESSPSQIARGDFNNDGKVDLAVTDNLSGNVDILLGNGTGAFGAPITSPGTATPSGIVVGDFNGDGTLDLAISNYGTQDLRILQGNGQGQFVAVHTYVMDSNAAEVAKGDFNHDGIADLAVGVFNISTGGHIATYLGNGDGSFRAGQDVPASDPHGLVAADLDGDGNMDLATASYATSTVVVALGDGAGGFGIPCSYKIPGRIPYPYDLAGGDFNGDGRHDLVTANYGNGSAIVLLSYPVRRSPK